MTDYINLVDKVFVTEIYNEFTCDTFAPQFHKMVGESLQYTSVGKFQYCSETDIHYRFIEYTGKRFMTKLQWMNLEETNYLNTLWKLVRYGELRKNRTGVDTKSLFACVGNYDLTDTFPALTTRRAFL